MRFTVDRIDHVVLNCRDVEVTASWYQRVLGMDREDFGEDKRIALKFGGQKINLRPETADAAKWIAASNTGAGAGDLCFIATIGWDEVAGHLHDCGVTIVEGTVSRMGALGAMKSIYCRDPDGTLVEIASYLAT
jgi:catechol 2,3-dioxygenase-like lactoylglutathione lyase family enzyme